MEERKGGGFFFLLISQTCMHFWNQFSFYSSFGSVVLSILPM